MTGGTITATGSTVTMAGDATAITGGDATLDNLTIDPAGSGLVDLTTSQLNVGGALSIAVNDTFRVGNTVQLLSTGSLTLTGTILGYGSGVFIYNPITTFPTTGTLSGSSGSLTLRFDAAAGDINIPERQYPAGLGMIIEFYNTSASSRTITIGTATSQSFDFSGMVQIVRTGAGTLLVELNTYDPIVNLAELTIGAGTTLSASNSSLLTLKYNPANNGTFTHNNGTVTTSSGGAIFDGDWSGSSAFYNLNIDRTVDFNAPVQTDNTFTLDNSSNAIDVEFEATGTYEFADIIWGQAGTNAITMHSETSADWDLKVTEDYDSQQVSYVNVSRSNACIDGGQYIDATDGTNTNSANNDCWDFTVSGIQIQGTNNAALIGDYVKYAVNEVRQTRSTLITTTSFSIPNVVGLNDNDIITLWVEPSSGSSDQPTANETSAITEYDGVGNLTQMELELNVLSVGSDTNREMSIGNFSDWSTYNNIDDEDIMFYVNSACTRCILEVDKGDAQYTDETLKILNGDSLRVSSMEANDEGIETHNLTIDSGGELIASGSTGSSVIEVSGSWLNNGSFTITATNGPNVLFTSGSGTETINSTGAAAPAFEDIEFDDSAGSATFQLESNLDVDNDLIISGGTLDTKSGSNYDINVGGSWSNSDIFTAQSGKVTFDGATSETITPGSSLFYDLDFSNGSGQWTLQAAMGVTNDVVVTAGTLAGAVDLTVKGGDLTGNGTVNMTGGTVELQNSGNLGGDTAWTFSSISLPTPSPCDASDTTTATGTGNMNVTSQILGSGQCGSDPFYNHGLNGGSKTWTMSGTGTTLSLGSGSLSEGTSTFSYTGLGGVYVGNELYYNLRLEPASGPRVYEFTSTNVYGVSNSLYINSNVTLNANSSFFATSGAGSVTIDANGETFYDFLPGATTTTVTNTDFNISNEMTAYGGSTFTIPSSRSVTLLSTGSTNPSFFAGTIDGAGTFIYQLPTAYPTTGTINSILQFDSVDNNQIMSNRTYGGLVEINNSGSTNGRTVTMSSGTHTLSDSLSIFQAGGGTVALTGAANDPTVNVAGDVTVIAGTLTGSADIIIDGGDLTGDGTVNMIGGTVTMKNSGNIGGDTAWTFSTLFFSTPSICDHDDDTQATGIGGMTITTQLLGENRCGVEDHYHYHYLRAGSKTWTLSGTGTPLSLVSLREETSTFSYTGLGAVNVGNDDYYNLRLEPASGPRSYDFVGNGVYAVSNAFYINSNVTLNANSSFFITTGAGSVTIDANGETFYNYQSSATTTVTNTDFNVSNQFTMWDAKTLTIPTSRSITLLSTGSTGSGLAFTGTVAGAGTFIYQPSTAFPTEGTFNSIVQFDSADNNQTMSNRTYGGLVEINNSGATDGRTVTMLSSTHTLSDGLTILSSGTGSVALTGSANNPTVNIAGDLTYTVGGGTKTITTGTGTWTDSGNVNLTNGTFTATAGNTLKMDGTSKSIISASQTLQNFEVSGGSVANVDAMDVNGTFDVTSGGFSQGATANLNVAGDFTLANGTNFTKPLGVGLLIFDGDLAFADNTFPLQDLGSVEIGASPDTTDLTTDFSSTNLKIKTLDVFNTNGYNVDLGNKMDCEGSCTFDLSGGSTVVTVGGNWTMSVSGTFTTTGSLVEFDSSTSNQTVTTGDLAFNDFKVNNSGSPNDNVIISGALDINGDLTVDDGELEMVTNDPAVNTAGSVTFASGVDVTKGTGTWTFDGTTAEIYTDSTATPQNIGVVVFNKTNGTPANDKITLASDMTVDTADIQTGDTLDLASGPYTLILANAGATATVLTTTGTLTPGYINGKIFSHKFRW